MNLQMTIVAAAVLGLCVFAGTFVLLGRGESGDGTQVTASANLDWCFKRMRTYAPPCAPEVLDTAAERALFRKKFRAYVDRIAKKDPDFNRDAAIAKFDRVMANVDHNGRYIDPRPGALEDARANWNRQEELSLDMDDQKAAAREMIERMREDYANRQSQEEPPLE
jgi:hypothetical protein